MAADFHKLNELNDCSSVLNKIDFKVLDNYHVPETVLGTSIDAPVTVPAITEFGG